MDHTYGDDIRPLKLSLVVVSVLALTGCNNAEEEAKKKVEEVLERCYSFAEHMSSCSRMEKSGLCPRKEDVIYGTSHYWKWLEQSKIREKYGVSHDGYITEAGRYRCKRLIELGEFT